MKVIGSLLLVILFALVEVYSQALSYVTFMGNNIPNHSYVKLTTVGTEYANTVHCHTDLQSCCSGSQGPDRGDWYFPNGTRLKFRGNVYEGRTDRRVGLFYNSSGGTSGIYRCDIETTAVNENDGYESFYVGLYTSGGDVTIPGGMTLTGNFDLKGDCPNFTLTCNSTGGPVTTVTWTRESQKVSGGVTVLDDPETAKYTHTLTVTERLGGQYQCTVANNKPSNATAQFTLQAECLPPCGNGGICTAPGICRCLQGWSGIRCNKAVCDRECQNRGNCTRPGVCDCLQGWSGKQCDTAECFPPCGNGGICTAPGVCRCPQGWSGIRCNKAVCDPECQNGGICTRPGVCDCLQGWSGNQCDTAVCVLSCQNGGTCLIPGVCLCPPGWSGDRCEKAECLPPCGNGGTCTAAGVCQCPQDWSGFRCNKAVCDPDCRNGGSCTRPGVCDCLQGWFGHQCDKAECVPSCQNGGSCLITGGCLCPPGWSGDRCEKAECFPPCGNGGTCTAPGVCQCPQGWSGIRCNKALCVPDCQNGGVCTEPDVCHCPSRWHGDSCQIAFTIGFVNDSFCVNESVGVVEIKVALLAGELRGNQYIIVKFSLTDGSSSGGEDYEPLSKQLVFKKNTTKYTVNVSIINDNIIDHNETFLAHLTLLSPLDESNTILLSPNSTEVRIKDNDTVTIGFTSTYYFATVGMTKILLNISVLEGVVSRNITLSVSTRDIIPISVRSYVPVVNATVSIHPNRTTAGVLVTILDVIGLQVFSAHLSLVSPLSDRITVKPTLVPIYIIGV